MSGEGNWETKLRIRHAITYNNHEPVKYKHFNFIIFKNFYPYFIYRNIEIFL